MASRVLYRVYDSMLERLGMGREVFVDKMELQQKGCVVDCVMCSRDRVPLPGLLRSVKPVKKYNPILGEYENVPGVTISIMYEGKGQMRCNADTKIVEEVQQLSWVGVTREEAIKKAAKDWVEKNTKDMAAYMKTSERRLKEAQEDMKEAREKQALIAKQSAATLKALEEM